MTTPPVLSIEGLSVGYADDEGTTKPAVWKVDLNLLQGSVLGLAGESGCGKSTTALTALGYSPPGVQVLSGSVVMAGVDLLGLSAAELRRFWGRRIAYVAQSAAQALNPAHTIGRQVREVLVRHLALDDEAARRRQLDLLETVGIPDPRSAVLRYPHQFSGGQQQRIALAIAIACRPEVLVLDEPTTGLDVTTQARISALLRALVDETGAATLLVSHDLALLSTVADRLAIMYAGQIVELGDTAEVMAAPRHPYTQRLLESVPSTRAARVLRGIPGSPPAQIVTDACAFAPRCSYVTTACRQASPPLVSDGERRIRCIRAEEITFVSTAASVRPPIMTPGKRLLDIESLWCVYGEQDEADAAVRDFSLDVAECESVGIVGESGSGKSTVLRTIAGLHAPRRGMVRFRGETLAARAVDRPRRQCGDIQIIFQNPDSSLNPNHGVLELIRRPLRLFHAGMSAAEEVAGVMALLDQVRLPRTVLHRLPHELSGGQKQRVAIARALAASPTLLLCDEITSSLDVSVQATILELIVGLAAEAKTALVFVSHDLSVVRAVATRGIVMRNGEICESGLLETLFERPQHPYTKELIASIPVLP